MPRICDCYKRKVRSSMCGDCHDQGYIYDSESEEDYTDECCGCSICKPAPALKMNSQTVFVTRPISVLETTEVLRVPVYEASPYGTVNVYYYDDYIDVVNSDGVVESYNVKTGIAYSWYTRPILANVLTMGMKEGVGGYFYQFFKDGSILTKSPEKDIYYWGPIESDSAATPLSIVNKTTTMYYGYPMELKDRHAEFMAYREQDEDDDPSWMWEKARLTDEERLAATEQWLAALKAHVEHVPGVKDNEANRTMHEQCIETATKEIARLKGE